MAGKIHSKRTAADMVACLFGLPCDGHPSCKIRISASNVETMLNQKTHRRGQQSLPEQSERLQARSRASRTTKYSGFVNRASGVWTWLPGQVLAILLKGILYKMHPKPAPRSRGLCPLPLGAGFGCILYRIPFKKPSQNLPRKPYTPRKLY